MSAKSVIQKLEDCDLIRLFLQFVQTYHLQYEKTSKEISYKCFEATWILVNHKANGFGRTESQAYKHALRNLLQILIEQPMYTEFFSDSLSIIQNNNRPSIKKQSISQSTNTCSKKIISSKTQGYEPMEKETKSREDTHSKLYQSYSRINQKSQSKIAPKDWQKPSVKIIQSLNSYQTSHTQNQKRLNQNLQSSQGYNTKIQRKNNGSTSEELRRAMKKLAQVEEYLSSINKQNESLKRQIKQMNEKQNIHQKEEIAFTKQTDYVQKVEVLDDAQFCTFPKNKPLIPKLKLEILPNYHKKTEKSLNESLLAAYNEKREQSVKKLVC